MFPETWQEWRGECMGCEANLGQARVRRDYSSESGLRDVSFSFRRVSWEQLSVVEAPMLAFLLIVFAIAALVTPEFELKASGVSIPILYFCPFFAATGIPCLFCGMTRSFLAMGSLDLGGAFSFHPLGPALFVSLVCLAMALIVSLVMRRRIRISVSRALRRRLIAGGTLLLLSTWVLKLVIWRNTGLI